MVEPITLAPWPSFDEEQVQAASDVLRSGKVNYWTGREARDFEAEFADWCGAKHGLAVSNGTVSLEVILRGLRLKPGDEVITTPRTFVASASAFVLHGVRPVLADICRDSGCITPESVEPLITSNTRAIVPVHLGGWPCDMEGFRALADERKLAIIEDCAQSHGAKIGDRHVGSWSEAASWSFCQDKIMTTGGEGGMVTTDDEDLWKRMWSLKDHGKSYDAVYHRQHPPGFRWLHETWGTNWRMTEFQAAIGRIQIRRMDEWHKARAANAALFIERLQGIPGIRLPLPGPGLTHAWYRLYLYIEEAALADGWSRDRVQQECQELGLTLSVGSCSEIYLEKCFQMCGMAPANPLPNARELTGTALALLVHPGITPEQIHQTADVLTSVLAKARK
jgi:dTDP-4-amino-4,6-dideoxygalactose transaminase